MAVTKLPLLIKTELPQEKLWIHDFVTEVTKDEDSLSSLYMQYDEEGLCLIEKGPLKPLRADFLSGELQHKRRMSIGKNSLIGKALGVAKGNRRIVDANMGMAGDTWMFLCMGLTVIAIERSPVVYSLVRDGIERAKQNSKFTEWLGDRLTLVFADSFDFLENFKEEADVIFFDFMFEEDRSALPKKTMQLFHKLKLSDQREIEIVKKALKLPVARVLVKRHSQAKPLLPSPNHSYEGKSIRYDYYLP